MNSPSKVSKSPKLKVPKPASPEPDIEPPTTVQGKGQDVPKRRKKKKTINVGSPHPPPPPRPSHEHHEAFSMRAKKQTEHDYKFDEHWKHVVDEAAPVPDEFMGEVMFRAERILRIFLHVIGRYPLTTRSIKKGHVHFEVSWTRPQGIYFIVTSVIIFFLFSFGMLNMSIMGYGVLDSLWDERFTPAVAHVVRTRETACFHRGFLLLVVIATNIINSTVGTVVVFKKRHIFASYFGFWASSLQNTQLDSSPGIVVGSSKAIAGAAIVALWLVIGFLLKLATMVNGAVAFAVVSFRLFSPLMLLPDADNHFNSQFYLFTTIAIILSIFSMLWSRSFVFVYYVKIKELINALGTWNGRVYGSVLRSDNPQSKEARTTYSLLFKDHCVLLDLIDSTNSLFSGILESYFFTHAFCFIFETFFFFVILRNGHRLDRASMDHSNDEGELVNHGQYFVRRFDVFSALIIFLLDQYFYFMVLLSSTEVSEEVMGGLEIARRTSLVGRKSDDELFFILSLFNSYNRCTPMDMEGGGYFKINKELFVTFVVVLILCIVIGLMFRPIYDWPEDRNIVGPFITALEGLDDCHWRVSQENWTTCNV